ncbi:methyl-accepting chemotaxis protein, partial [Marinomonas spartinae]|uniref:methyl-accepting chemotaxis protein n=1 Tax=Marinomonas spartinae TaxID=1792290 RepID=UPI0018F18DB1
LISLSSKNENDAAKNLYINESRKSYDEFSKSLDDLASFDTKKANEASQFGDTLFDKSIFVLSIISFVIIAFTLSIGLYITRSLTRQINLIQQAMMSLAGGDLSVKLPNPSKNELGILSRHFNTAVQQFAQTVSHIQNSSTQLATTAEQLSLVTNETSKDIHLQNEQLEMAATAVTEMTVAVEDVAENAINTSKESDLARERANEGSEQVKLSSESVSLLLKELQDTSNGVDKLVGQVKNITSVLDVIREIAEQTNLLALNAAIEAARAGEAGRGFAVVADEVRALAHRTQESTKEIESMISAVESGTNDTVVAIQSSHERAKVTMDAASQTGIVIQKIVEAVLVINERNTSIASSTEQQANVAREVDRNLTTIRDISNETSSRSVETSASSQELAKLAEELNQLTSQFKI